MKTTRSPKWIETDWMHYMTSRAIFLSCVGAVALGTSAANAQTAVERNLPPAPPPSQATVDAGTDVPVSQDDAPFGASLKAIVLLDDDDAVMDAAAVSPGVHAAQLPQLGEKRLNRALARFLGQPLSRKLVSEIQAEIAKSGRASGRPFISLSTPEQEITTGVLQIRVLEFRTGQIAVRGAEGRKAKAIEAQVRTVPGEPIDATQLAEDLDWLGRNPFLTVGAQFAPAQEEGLTDLTLAADVTRPFRLYGGWSNTGSQSTGTDRFYVGGMVELPVLSGGYASYQLTGSRDFWAKGGRILRSEPRYLAHGGRLYIPTGARQNLEILVSDALTNQVIDANFSVRQRTTEGTLGYRMALSNLGLSAGSGDLLIGIEGKHQHRTVLFGDEVALETSADLWQGLVGWSKSWLGNGRRVSAALNLHGSPGGVTSRNTAERLAEISNGRITSARYAYATLDLSGQTRLPNNFALTSQLSAQFAGKALPLATQVGLGGDGLVRGYTPDDGSFDSGVVMRNELHIPPFNLAPGKRDLMSPYLFVDAAYGRDHALRSNEAVASVGVGTDYRIGRHFSAGVNSAWALTDGQRTQSGDWRIQARVTVSF
ncbi:ShlB/FhaC/HecB family hemolysin secretion/activation protein [Sphingobium lignivorans]|uniref:Hemolysin activation/secretion protein n=1 Tax=Sphingobium lignivorans TaxID=2735886 RepID=A0ABR6NG18_9SPHN|nr:ShlB/FhaC/HecB family hemolysin secretion/activation protein [Sphingobium lignivorans]MBB5985448.1 hemolysin activation/secretion protein [Sphingobium lignivorans]